MGRHVLRLQSVVENLVQSALLTRHYLQIQKPYYQKDSNIFLCNLSRLSRQDRFELCNICIVSTIKSDIGVIH